MTTFSPQDRVCVKGGGDTVFIIKGFRRVEEAVCVKEGSDKKGHRDGRTRFFNVEKLEYPDSHSSKPRKWTKSERGGGQYVSSDGWLVFQTEGGTWIAQKGKVMSEAMKLKRDVYKWIDEREEGQ